MLQRIQEMCIRTQHKIRICIFYSGTYKLITNVLRLRIKVYIHLYMEEYTKNTEIAVWQ